MSASDLEAVLDELGKALRAVDPGELRALQERVGAARRVFVAGAGRSGLVVRAFAMRLMHLGLQVYVVGDVTTPAFAAGDLLVIGSGSGETDSLCAVPRKAKALGGVLAVVTIVPPRPWHSSPRSSFAWTPLRPRRPRRPARSDAGASSPWAPSSNRRCCSCSTLS